MYALALLRPAGAGRQLWIGTDGGGAAVLDPDAEGARCRTLQELGLPRLPNGVVYGIVTDAAGRIYLPTNRGVVRLTLAATPAETEVELLTVEHGLPASQASRGAAVVDERGRIWVGTVGGAAALDPAREPRDRSPKRIVLEATVAELAPRPVADGVNITVDAAKKLAMFERCGFGGLPICMAKTQNSISDDPKLLGRPKGFRITVRDFEIANGPGFIVALTGDILRMPALPKEPAAERIDLDDEGRIIGV